jgi:nicotinate-nucleotide adenylyltransferase
MNKIIFGGSFDPIHNGHLFIAKMALDYTDRVVFVPCNQNPLGKSIKTNSATRKEMISMAIKKNHRFELSDFELENQGISYTYNTVQYFLQQGVKEIGLIIGYDIILDLKKWYKYEELCELVTFYLFKRPDVPEELVKNEINVNLKKANIKFIDSTPINISSTMIKIYKYMNEDISQFVPLDVANYIEEQNIYLKEKQFPDVPDNTMLCNPHINGRIINHNK